MRETRLLGMILLFGPVVLGVGVGLSKYEWVWNRTNLSIPISCAAALLSLLAMALGLHFISSTRSKFIGRGLALTAVICVVQFFNVASEGVANPTKRVAFSDGRTAFSLRYAAFGSSWTDLYVTQSKWLILRETYHVRQYETAAVTELQTDDKGGLRVHYSEYGKSQTPKFDVYSANDLQRIREKLEHPPRL